MQAENRDTNDAPVIIAQRYLVEAPLGEGASGEVHKVWDTHEKVHAALKLLRHDGPDEAWEEAALLRKLDGDFGNVLRVRNADVVQGIPYIVTDIAVGTVADRLVDNVGLSVYEACRWTSQAAAGLARIHHLGLVHNDIKPNNLFLDDKNDILVGDLGLASKLNPSGFADACGTPATMAPEAIIGYLTNAPTASIQSDVYSLAATLYWMLAGRPPRQTDGPVDLADLARIPPTPLLDTAPHVPRGLAAFIMEALSMDSTLRPRTVGDFANTIDSRPHRDRQWIPLRPHPEHVRCYRGTHPSRAPINVCVLPTTGKKLLITASFDSNRRATPDILVTERQAPQKLRSLFRQLQ